MTERINTIQRNGGRFYVDPTTREKLPSVTTILGMIPKPFLQQWAAKVVAEYAVQHMPELFPLAIKDPKAAVDVIKAAPRRYTQERANLGTAAHDLFERMCRGEKLGRVDPELHMYRDAFARWLDRWQPTIVGQEYTVWESHDGYAGSADALVEIDGERIILDVKTSKDVYPDTALQLAAYRFATEILMPDGTRVPNFTDIKGGAILHVGHDGKERFIPAACDVEQYDVFLTLLNVFNYEQNKRGLLGAEL